MQRNVVEILPLPHFPSEIIMPRPPGWQQLRNSVNIRWVERHCFIRLTLPVSIQITGE